MSRASSVTQSRYSNCVLRSPWLGLLAIAVAGVVGYALSDTGQAARVIDGITVTIRATRDNGAAWDFGGGLPDPKIRVEHAGTVLATCEHENTLKATCKVGKRADGPVRVIVDDIDTSDHDRIGELQLGAPTSGALQVEATTASAGAWERLRALWIALAIGLALAGALAVYRRRHA